MIIDANNIKQVKELAKQLRVNWFGLSQAIKQADIFFLESKEEAQKKLDELERNKRKIMSDDEHRAVYEKDINDERISFYKNISFEQYLAKERERDKSSRADEQKERDMLNRLMSEERHEEYQKKEIESYKKQHSGLYEADGFARETCRRRRYKVNILEAKEQIQNALDSWIGKNHSWLKAYDTIVDWLTDNKNRGLVMLGNCGTGKTVMCKIILSLVKMQALDYKSNHSKMFSAWNLNKEKEDILNFFEEHTNVTIIDDVGVESPLNDYGNKSMVFTEIVDVADRYGKLLVISTNLTLEGLRGTYGDRTVDRLKGMCQFVVFEGESMRKLDN